MIHRDRAKNAGLRLYPSLYLHETTLAYFQHDFAGGLALLQELDGVVHLLERESGRDVRRDEALLVHFDHVVPELPVSECSEIMKSVAGLGASRLTGRPRCRHRGSGSARRR